MFEALSIILILVSVLLVAVILLQPGKSDMISGLSGIGSQFSNVFGAGRTMNILSRATIIFAGIIMGLALITNLFIVGPAETVERAVTEIEAQESNVPSPIMPSNIPAPDNPKQDAPEQGN